eukprot:TRINITY_DN17079_c0_g1_i1.p1 TRINITY_DN17079_c0_g1~~TRINITY_DN17079_c0_g1_i1.p1  ORF type:complete len:162 (-),score=36.57 TRINITY_DN17079_c0_g1_i1:1-486(-)
MYCVGFDRKLVFRTEEGVSATYECDSQIHCLRFATDSHVVIGAEDKSVRVVRADGSLACTGVQHGARVRGVDAIPNADGSLAIVSCDSGGSVCFWTFMANAASGKKKKKKSLRKKRKLSEAESEGGGAEGPSERLSFLHQHNLRLRLTCIAVTQWDNQAAN